MTDSEHTTLAAMGDQSEVGSIMYFLKLYFYDFFVAPEVSLEAGKVFSARKSSRKSSEVVECSHEHLG